MSDALNIFGKDHIMVDLETLSTKQNAVIVSIGATHFTFENGIKHELLVNIDPIDSVKYGLSIEKSTLEWWDKQPKEVSDAWKISPKPLEVALNHFNDFVGNDSKIMIWAMGAVFDLGVLRSNFEKTKIKRNWQYWNEMDCRTVFNLLGVRNDKIRANQSGHHNALQDAISQTKTLIELLT